MLAGVSMILTEWYVMGGWDGTMASNMGWSRRIGNGDNPVQQDRLVRRHCGTASRPVYNFRCVAIVRLYLVLVQ